MAVPLTTQLQTIVEKVSELGALNRSLNDRIETLESENSDLRSQLDERQKELEVAKRDIEFLTMSHRLADSPDSIISARRRIARLIRTIDNCISMLKEE